MEKYNIARHYVDYKEMIENEKPDFVDIITPPETHYEITKFAADRGIDVICQKPLAPTYEEAREIVEYTQKAGIRLYADGKLTVQLLGKPEIRHKYDFQNINFAGDCVYFTQKHYIDCLNHEQEFETNGTDYLKSLLVQEAIYKSAGIGMPVAI